MTNEIQIWDQEIKLSEIQNVLCKNLSDTEFKIFVEMGKALKLNPFLKEIWAVKYGNSPAQIFIGRDGYRKNAQRNPEYSYHTVDAVYENDGFEIVNAQVVHKYNLKERGKLKGAYCTVKRKHAEKEMFTFVEFSEYSTGQSLWKTKPATMIKKVAEAQGLRAAFQEMFQGTYDESEDWTDQKGKENYAVVQPKILKEAISDLPIDDEQVSIIGSLMIDLKMSEDNLEKPLAYFGVKSIMDLNHTQASRLIHSLTNKLPKDNHGQTFDTELA